jgi:hypothetical protein
MLHLGIDTVFLDWSQSDVPKSNKTTFFLFYSFLFFGWVLNVF